MPLTILYGSQTGTAERQAYRIARMALRRGECAVRCLAADETAVANWPACCAEGGHVILVLANANQGEAPETYRHTWAQLLTPDAPSMAGLSYGVFGLGDSLYAKFNYMAKMTHNRLRQLGGTPLLLRGLGDESDAKGLDDALLPWLTELWAALGYTAAAPTQPAQQEPLDAELFPLFAVTVSPRVGIEEKDGVKGHYGDDDGTENTAKPARREPTFTCTVTKNSRLTAADHFQAVHHIDFTIDSTANVHYEVGDALGVYCTNCRENVDFMLDFCGLAGGQAVTVSPATGWGLVEQTARPFFGKPMTARHFFTHHVDLEAVTEQDFFWMMSHFVAAGDHNRPGAVGGGGQGSGSSPAASSEGGPTAVQECEERLRELANPANPDDFLVYAYREKRNVAEVLRDFNVGHEVRVRPPLDFLLSFLTPMRPRLFSLASCPAAADDAIATTRASLAVARLAWTTPMRRPRQGMCSTALTAAQPNDTFQCFVWQGTLTVPPSPSPLLLVATGTGVAPMRALLHYCAAHAAAGWSQVPMLLFFGCRHAGKDFLYREEWEWLRTDGGLHGLTVVPAFSRDDATRKVYVQHQLGQNAARVGALLLAASAANTKEMTATESKAATGAPAAVVAHSSTVTYVCGNAKNMPKDVQSVLQDIIDQVCCGGDAESGRLFMKRLQQEGRYQVDTWSA